MKANIIKAIEVTFLPNEGYPKGKTTFFSSCDSQILNLNYTVEDNSLIVMTKFKNKRSVIRVFPLRNLEGFYVEIEEAEL